MKDSNSHSQIAFDVSNLEHQLPTIHRTDCTDRTDRTDCTDRTDRTDCTDRTDRTDCTDRSGGDQGGD